MTFRNRFRNQLADVLSNVFSGMAGNGGGGIDPDSILLWDMTSDGSGAPPVEADISGNGWQGSYGGSGQTFNGDSVTFTTATSNNLSVDTPSVPVGTSGAPSEFTVLMKLNALTTGGSNVLFVVIGPGGGTNSYTFVMWSSSYQIYDGGFKNSGVLYSSAHRDIAVRFINDGGTQKYELYIDGAIVTGAPVTVTTKDLTACDFFIMSNNAGGQSTAGEVARTEIIGRNMTTTEIDAWFAAAS